MTFASAFFFLGFTLLIALGVFALGLLFAAAAFALIAAAMDTYRFAARWTRFSRRVWHGFGESGRQFACGWAGLTLCAFLAVADAVSPRPVVGCGAAFDGFDLLGIALAVPAVLQIADRLAQKGSTPR